MNIQHEYTAWKMVFLEQLGFFLFLTGNLFYMNQRKLRSKPEDMGHYVTCWVTAFMSPNKVAAGITLFPSSSAQISTCISKRKTTINSRTLKRTFFFQFKRGTWPNIHICLTLSSYLVLAVQIAFFAFPWHDIRKSFIQSKTLWYTPILIKIHTYP